MDAFYTKAVFDLMFCLSYSFFAEIPVVQDINLEFLL